MHPDPLFTFNLFGNQIGIYPYGLFIGVGILLCLIVFFVYTKKKNMPERVTDFSFFVAFGAIALGFLCAMLYQAVYNWIEDGVFKFGSGMTAMGGFIGGAAFFIIFYFGFGKVVFKGEELGIHKKEFNKIVLVAPICITIAHAFGRIGCLMAGCCYGKVASSGFTIFNHGAERIPVQLYEAIFLFLLFIILSVLYFKKCNCTMQIYLIAYGVWRIIIEFFRDDPRGAMVLGISPSQWQSILFIAGGVIMFIIYIVKKIPLFFKDEKA